MLLLGTHMKGKGRDCDTMRRNRKTRWLGAVTTAAGLSLALVFLPSAAASASSGVTTGGTFIVAQPWGTLADNFNPYAPSGEQHREHAAACISRSITSMERPESRLRCLARAMPGRITT